MMVSQVPGYRSFGGQSVLWIRRHNSNQNSNRFCNKGSVNITASSSSSEGSVLKKHQLTIGWDDVLCRPIYFSHGTATNLTTVTSTSSSSSSPSETPTLQNFDHDDSAEVTRASFADEKKITTPLWVRSKRNKLRCLLENKKNKSQSQFKNYQQQRRQRTFGGLKTKRKFSLTVGADDKEDNYNYDLNHHNQTAATTPEVKLEEEEGKEEESFIPVAEASVMPISDLPVNLNSRLDKNRHGVSSTDGQNNGTFLQPQLNDEEQQSLLLRTPPRPLILQQPAPTHTSLTLARNYFRTLDEKHPLVIQIA